MPSLLTESLLRFGSNSVFTVYHIERLTNTYVHFSKMIKLLFLVESCRLLYPLVPMPNQSESTWSIHFICIKGAKLHPLGFAEKCIWIIDNTGHLTVDCDEMESILTIMYPNICFSTNIL